MNDVTKSETAGKFLSRDEILGFDDLKTEDVVVHEWGGGIVRIRALTATERDRYEASLFEMAQDGKMVRDKTLRDIRSKLVCLTATSQDNKPLFSFNDVKKLGKKNAAAVDKLFAIAQRLSGIRKADLDEMKENLDKVQSESSASD